MQSALVEASWEQLYQQINVQVPHAKIFNLRIREGAVENGRIQPTILLTREEAAERTAPSCWNAQWKQFRAVCAELRNGVLPEVTFRDGNPQVILPEPYEQDFLAVAMAKSRSPNLRRMAVAA